MPSLSCCSSNSCPTFRRVCGTSVIAGSTTFVTTLIVLIGLQLSGKLLNFSPNSNIHNVTLLSIAIGNGLIVMITTLIASRTCMKPRATDPKESSK